MGSLTATYLQENLVSISKLEYLAIRRAIQVNKLLHFSRSAWVGGDKFGWRMKTEPSAEGTYLLVEHYELKAGGGLAVAYKADKSFLLAFKNLSAETGITS